MHEYRFDETNHLRGASANRGSVFPGATKDGELGIHNPWPMVMDSRPVASDLGFTRDRHHEMRTSATAGVRRRPLMTPHMIQICGSTFYFIAGRSPEPPEAAAMRNLGQARRCRQRHAART